MFFHKASSIFLEVEIVIISIRGGFRGGGGDWGNAPSPLYKDSTPCRSKGFPFCTILRYPFLVTDHQIFLKAPLAPIYTNFEGGARAEKLDFWTKFSKKCLKTPLSACFFIRSTIENPPPPPPIEKILDPTLNSILGLMRYVAEID